MRHATTVAVTVLATALAAVHAAPVRAPERTEFSDDEPAQRALARVEPGA